MIKLYTRQNILFAMMLLPLMFDYRSTDGDSKSFIITITITSIISSLLLLASLKKINCYALLNSIPIFVFIGFTSLIGLCKGQTIDIVSASILPTILFLLFYCVTSSLNIERVDDILKITEIALIVSVYYKLFFGFYYYGNSIDDVRFEIISPAFVLLFAYGIASIFNEKYLTGIFAISSVMLVLFISVTRSYILVCFSVCLFWFFAYGSKYWFFNKTKIINIFIFFGVLLSILFLAIPNVFDRWVLRLFDSIEDHGGDVTFDTRMAETQYQLDILLDNPLNLITGMGIASETKFQSSYSEIMTAVLGVGYEYSSIGFGHNTYFGLIYLGGILVGGLFASWILLFVFANFLTLRKSLKMLSNKSSGIFCLGVGSSSAFGMSVLSFISGTLGDRLTAALFGLSLGLSIFGIRVIRS